MPIDRESLVADMSAAFRRGCGAFFVGAGISAASRLPTWNELLAPDLRALGLELQADDDLTAIAQYVVNRATGNRGPLINRIRAATGRSVPINPYHQAIAKCVVDQVWTTNYDCLLETAFADYPVIVRASDASMSHPSHDAEIEIIKIHGCATNSNHEDIVITKEDYEDFFVRRPATAHRLRTELLGRSMLFIGYSLRDRNIENIFVEARRLAMKATRRHYLIQKTIYPPDPQSTRQQLWAQDLARIGIECCFIDDYEELQHILDDLASRSRGRTLFVTGSHEKSDAGFAGEVGRRLTELDVVLLDGQSTGWSRDVVAAYTDACVKKPLDLRERMRLFLNPYAANPAYSNDRSLLPALKSIRRSLLRTAQAVLVFDGAIGTEMEVELAQSVGTKIIPVPTTKGGLADNLLQQDEVVKALAAACPEYVGCWRAGSVTPEDVVGCVAAMVR